MRHAPSTVDESPQNPTEDLTIYGGDDFIVEQGIADPDEFRMKSHLCHEIAFIVEARKLTPAAAAEITGQKQSDLSRIINHRHRDYSVWRLMKMLSALRADIVITVGPSSAYEKGIIYAKNVRNHDSDQTEAEMDAHEMQPAPGA